MLAHHTPLCSSSSSKPIARSSSTWRRPVSLIRPSLRVNTCLSSSARFTRSVTAAAASPDGVSEEDTLPPLMDNAEDAHAEDTGAPPNTDDEDNTTAADGAAESDADDEPPPPPSYAALLEKLEASVGNADANWAELVPAVAEEFASLQQRVDSNASSAAAFEDTLNMTKDQYLRLNADFDNFRKRNAQEKDQISERTRGQTVEALLPLVDTFDSAKKNLKLETEEAQKVADSYQGVYKMMIDVFKQLGVEEVPTVGEPFDPEMHNAIMREETDEFEDGIVMENFRPGFKIGDTLLRAAMVKVAVSLSGAAAAGEEVAKSEAEA
mmetsp:Transcript_8716/g.23386  ORF Transcript_8716/g.23386 Transcript_8716/m.23386 type:complete len:324 (-) Transcript_8716:1685-2656(-)